MKLSITPSKNTKKPKKKLLNKLMDGLFVTGTDTGVGKTEIACALACKYQSLVKKPVESGCDLFDDELFPNDADKLLQASGREQDLNQVCKFKFKEVVSPESAALLNKQKLFLNDLVDFCQTQEFTIIEGAGGFLSPIALDGTNADLAKKLNLPVVLVVANRLGCVNHTLLTIEAIEKRNLKLHRIFLNQNQNSAEDYLQDLQRWVKKPIASFKFGQSKEPWRSFDSF